MTTAPHYRVKEIAKAVAVLSKLIEEGANRHAASAHVAARYLDVSPALLLAAYDNIAGLISEAEGQA